MISIKSEREIELLRIAGHIVYETHQYLRPYIKEGITTKELDTLAEEFIRSKGATPSFKGYEGFPATICASINQEVVHGIPSNRRLRNGDIISIDIGACYKGYHGGRVSQQSGDRRKTASHRRGYGLRTCFGVGIQWRYACNYRSELSVRARSCLFSCFKL